MRPRVFLPQETLRFAGRSKDGSAKMEPAMDFTPAAKYGDIVVLVEHNKPVLATAPIIRTLNRKLKDFNDDDYIIATGDPSLMMIVASVAAKMNRGRYTLLKWDRRAHAYIPIIVNLHGEL